MHIGIGVEKIGPSHLRGHAFVVRYARQLCHRYQRLEAFGMLPIVDDNFVRYHIANAAVGVVLQLRQTAVVFDRKTFGGFDRACLNAELLSGFLCHLLAFGVSNSRL